MAGDSTLSLFTVTIFGGKCELVAGSKGDPCKDPSGDLLVAGVGRVGGCELDCHEVCTVSHCAL